MRILNWQAHKRLEDVRYVHWSTNLLLACHFHIHIEEVPSCQLSPEYLSIPPTNYMVNWKKSSEHVNKPINHTQKTKWNKLPAKIIPNTVGIHCNDGDTTSGLRQLSINSLVLVGRSWSINK